MFHENMSFSFFFFFKSLFLRIKKICPIPPVLGIVNKCISQRWLQPRINLCTISPQQKQTLSNRLISFDYFLKRCNLSGEIMYKSLSEATVIFASAVENVLACPVRNFFTSWRFLSLFQKVSKKPYVKNIETTWVEIHKTS